ncbi:MAG: hypothetical protein AB1420_13905 [Bacillota bacterium]
MAKQGAEIISDFIELSDYIRDLFDDDVIIGISDRETFLKYIPGKETGCQSQGR